MADDGDNEARGGEGALYFLKKDSSKAICFVQVYLPSLAAIAWVQYSS